MREAFLKPRRKRADTCKRSPSRASKAALLQCQLRDANVRIVRRVDLCASERDSARVCVCARGRCTCRKVIKRPLLEPQPLHASRRTSQFRQENARHNDEIYAARGAASVS